MKIVKYLDEAAVSREALTKSFFPDKPNNIRHWICAFRSLFHLKVLIKPDWDHEPNQGQECKGESSSPRSIYTHRAPRGHSDHCNFGGVAASCVDASQGPGTSSTM